MSFLKDKYSSRDFVFCSDIFLCAMSFRDHLENRPHAKIMKCLFLILADNLERLNHDELLQTISTNKKKKKKDKELNFPKLGKLIVVSSRFKLITIHINNITVFLCPNSLETKKRTCLFYLSGAYADRCAGRLPVSRIREK